MRRNPGAADDEETTATMPKMKTHSGTAKRFRLTGTGKVMRRRANRKPPAGAQVVPRDAPARQ